MPEESILQTVVIEDVDADLRISQSVDYKYSNYAEVSWSNTELRIAFGDDVPGTGVRPCAGVVLLLPYAQLLHEKLQEALDKFSAQQHARPVDPD